MNGFSKLAVPSDVPTYLAHVAYRFGERLADNVAKWVALHDDPTSPDAEQVPTDFVLELGAVLQLALWEATDLRIYLPKDLPSFAAALEEFQRRASLGSAGFSGDGNAPLFAQVFDAWLTHCAWQGPEAFGVDLVIGDFANVDTDELARKIALFIWQSGSAM